MGVLQSELFKDIDRLQDCAVRDAAHVVLKLPRERGEHVRAIQQALADLDGAAVVASETIAQEYGKSTADAVVVYKEKRGLRRPGQQVADNIVGTGTIRKMDEEWLQKKQHSGHLMQEEDPKELKQDICMSLLGGTVTVAANNLSYLTAATNTPEYLKTHHPLVAIDMMTYYLQRDKIVNDILNQVRLLRRQVKIDRILIRGLSSGGKIALMVVNGLHTQLRLSCRYLCVGDAALDKDDKLFQGGSGITACEESINFYQLWGNNVDPSGEVHGPIAGFKRNVRNLTCEHTATRNWRAQMLAMGDRDPTKAEKADAALNVHICNDSIALRKGQDDMNRIMFSPP